MIAHKRTRDTHVHSARKLLHGSLILTTVVDCADLPRAAFNDRTQDCLFNRANGKKSILTVAWRLSRFESRSRVVLHGWLDDRKRSNLFQSRHVQPQQSINFIWKSSMNFTFFRSTLLVATAHLNESLASECVCLCSESFMFRTDSCASEAANERVAKWSIGLHAAVIFPSCFNCAKSIHD